MMQMAAEAHEHINNQSWLATWVLDSGMGAAILGAAVTLRVVRWTTSRQTEQHLSSQTLVEAHHSNEINTIKEENVKAMAAQRSLFDEERTVEAERSLARAGMEAQSNLVLVASWDSSMKNMSPLSFEDCKAAASVLLANEVNPIILRDYQVGIASAQSVPQRLEAVQIVSRRLFDGEVADTVAHVTAVTEAFLKEIGQDPLTNIKA